ncbi:MAG: hypothetical protein C0518_06655 [Opitutus sp.]|nr:hypothetical protein [Opitutus sp.]
MPRGETEQHLRLKALTLAWARARGWTFAAAEVRVPRSGFRADVAAADEGESGGVVVFECKQSRADLLKDAHAEAVVRARTAELAQRQRVLEELLAVHRPELRRGEALWPEFDTWNFASLEHRTYRRVLGELAMFRRRLREGTKFSRMTRYQCADALYLVVEENIHAEAEIPKGWGLLVRRGDELRLARDAARLTPWAEQRAALRRAIAQKLAGPPVPPADLLFAGTA